VEDGVFVGSRVVIVEGVRIGREAVIGAGVVLTSSTAILDVSGPEVVEHRGYVPPRSVVIPGMRPKKFPAGEFGVPCALIIGQRTAGTDRKVSLNAALRDFSVPV
jgi:2,3,4,5-tetrahydropyridine-2-carboxylate N-succinyltransferase